MPQKRSTNPRRKANLSTGAKIAIGAGIVFIGLPIVAATAIAIVGARAVANVANQPFPQPTFPTQPVYPNYPSYPPTTQMRRGR